MSLPLPTVNVSIALGILLGGMALAGTVTFARLGSLQLNGYIRDMRLSRRRLPDEQLRLLTR